MASPTTHPFPGFLRRHTFAVACVVTSLILAGVDFFYWRQSVSLERRYAEKTTEGEDTLTLLASSPLLHQQYQIATEAVQRIEKHLLVEANLADNLALFYSCESGTGARLGELNQLNSPSTGDGASYRVIPFSLTVTGTFDQVAGFVRRLETGPNLLRVTTFTLQRIAPDGGSVSLNLTVELLGRP